VLIDINVGGEASQDTALAKAAAFFFRLSNQKEAERLCRRTPDGSLWCKVDAKVEEQAPERWTAEQLPWSYGSRGRF
jgi:hypothetical protein